MNICKLLGLHKGQRSQLQNFQGLFQHNGMQGYKQGLNNLLVITLQLQLRSQPRGSPTTTTKRERTWTMNIKITTKRITNNCNHKKERTRTTKIKITTSKKVATNCNIKKGKRKWWSTWGPQPKRSLAIGNIRDAKRARSRSSWPWRSLTSTMKRMEKEDNDQHEDRG